MTRYHGVYGAMCATKAGRENMAQQIAELAAPLGWETSIEAGYLDPLEVRVELKRGAYAVALHFIGKSQVGAFLAHWHKNAPYDAPDFTAGFAGLSQHRGHTHHKATTCEENWRPFLAKLKAGMEELNALLTEKAA